MFFDVKTLLSPCVSANPANSANLGETAAECTEQAKLAKLAKLASDEEEPVSGHAKLAEFAELASPLAGDLQLAYASMEAAKTAFIHALLESGERLLAHKNATAFGQWDKELLALAKANPTLSIDKAGQLLTLAQNRMLVLDNIGAIPTADGLLAIADVLLLITNATAAQCQRAERLELEAEQQGITDIAALAQLVKQCLHDEDQENRNVLAFQEKTQICSISEISSPLAFDENEPFTVYTSLGEPVTFAGQSLQYREWLIKMNPKRRVR